MIKTYGVTGDSKNTFTVSKGKCGHHRTKYIRVQEDDKRSCMCFVFLQERYVHSVRYNAKRVNKKENNKTLAESKKQKELYFRMQS